MNKLKKLDDHLETSRNQFKNTKRMDINPKLMERLVDIHIALTAIAEVLKEHEEEIIFTNRKVQLVNEDIDSLEELVKPRYNEND